MELSASFIKDLKKQDASAQRRLYQTYSPKWFAVCLRYMKDHAWAEDVMLMGCMKIFSNISNYKDEGKVEAWMYRIIVNECLMELRKKTNFNLSVEYSSKLDKSVTNTAETEMQVADILQIIQSLPEGCRTVFNLFEVEGYSHKEIAKMLGISEGTSKSQLNAAKNKLRELLPNEIKYKYV